VFEVLGWQARVGAASACGTKELVLALSSDVGHGTRVALDSLDYCRS
jgi:hypothetical protein